VDVYTDINLYFILGLLVQFKNVLNRFLGGEVKQKTKTKQDHLYHSPISCVGESFWENSLSRCICKGGFSDQS